MVIAFGKDLCMAKNTFVGGVLRREISQVVDVLKTIVKRDGGKMPNNDDLNVVSSAFVFVVKALWIRKIDIAFVERFADILPSVQKVLKNHDFNDVIYTYRSLNTNLYTQKTSKGRTYTLNKTTLTTYLNDVIAGKQNVLSRGKTTTQGKTMKNTLTNKLFNNFAATTSTPTKAKAKPQPQAKPQKTKSTTQENQKWVAISLKDAIVDKFHKIVDNKGVSYMGWVAGAKKDALILRNYKNTKTQEVKIADIANVYAYVRKGDR